MVTCEIPYLDYDLIAQYVIKIKTARAVPDKHEMMMNNYSYT